MVYFYDEGAMMKSFSRFLTESPLDKALSPDVRNIIISKRGKIYQVGGVVRDEILGKVSKDLDLLVVGIELDELGRLLSQFGKVNLVGKSFGILKFKPEGTKEEIDISVPRIDVKSTGKGHKDFEVKLGKGISLQQDQLRRDFWMNAIAKDVETGEVHDIEGRGQSNIDKKQVEMISPEAFKEDPLRMFRAVQFASRFGFKIESNTLKEIKNNAKLIKTVSGERFQEEFLKLYTKSAKPSIGIKLMFETGLMKQLFPSAKPKIDYRLMDRLDKNSFPAFMGLILKPYGTKAGKEAMKVMKVSTIDAMAIDCVVYCADQLKKLKDWEVVLYSSDKPDHALKNVNSVTQGELYNRLNRLKSKGRPTKLKELGINGRDLMELGLKGRKIGDALDHLLVYAVNTGVNDKEGLIKEAEKEFS